MNNRLESFLRNRWPFRGVLWRIERLIHPPHQVLGRVACLGGAVFSNVQPRLLKGASLINQQKCRCDLLMKWIHGAQRPDASRVIPYLDRSYVQPWIEQQQDLPWFSSELPKRYSLLIMDSFAELTDQRFRHRTEGWEFCCHYRDLRHTSTFSEEFECKGLLPAEEFHATYTAFFDYFFRQNPAGQIIFIHFPTKLDGRVAFKERAELLKVTLDALASYYPGLHSLHISEDDVEADQNTSHPYHFSSKTVEAFCSLWATLPPVDRSLRQFPSKFQTLSSGT